jgi:hypothetical protein
MAEKTGWLEKWHQGRVISILEVQYHRVKVKKTPRKQKGGHQSSNHRDESLYYMLDKKVDMGELSLTGNSVFGKNELVEVALPVTKFNTKLRLLGRIPRVTTFMEMKRVVFRGHVKFAAVNKQDFDAVVSMEKRGVAPTRKTSKEMASHKQPGGKNHLKITFKKS